VRAAVRAREKASMTRAAAWLQELGLGQYAQVFAKQSERLGIPFGHRKRMFKAIAALARSKSSGLQRIPTKPPLHSPISSPSSWRY
jgi:hypothetical protein